MRLANKLIQKTAFLALLLMSIAAQAQTDALLWKVSGNGLTKPSYIFGTIHLHCNPEFASKPAITEAITASDVVAMELNLNDFDVRTSIYKAYMEEASKPLSTLLTKEQYALFDSVCRNVLKDSAKLYDKKTPMNVLTRLYSDVNISGCAQPVPIDLMISTLAAGYGKEIFGLENVQFQDSLLKSIPDSVQVRWLMDFCKNIGKAKSDFAEMLDVYNKQLSIELYKVSAANTPDMKYFEQVLVNDRNDSWVKFLKDNMSNYSIFMAVGSLHLQGSTGLIPQLKKLGYTLTPITIK